MTREEQIRILTEARERAFKQIDLTEGCEMGSEDFVRLLRAVRELGWMATPHCDFPVLESGHNAPEEADESKRNLPNVRIERVGNQVLAEIVDEPVVAEVKITPVVEAEPEKPTMSKEEVRDKLSTYSNKYDHLDVAAIMSEMGYSKLSDIPAVRYAELLEKVEAAIKEGA